MSYPEQVGRTLQNAGIVLKSRDSTRSLQHSHQIMTNKVVTNIYYIIFLPDVSCCFGITVCKGLHCPLQDTPSLSPKFEHTIQDKYFCHLTIFVGRNRRISLDLNLRRITTQGGHTKEYLRNTSSTIACAFEITRD